MTDPRNLIIYALLALLLGMSALAGLQLNRLHDEQRAHAQTRQEHAEVLRALAQREASLARAALEKQESLARALAESDRKHTEELSNALSENDRLRAAVRAGDVRLRVRAVCPAAPARADVPEAAPAAGVADAATPRLTADAEQAYFDHRAAAEQVKRMLLGLQDYARAITGAAPAE